MNRPWFQQPGAPNFDVLEEAVRIARGESSATEKMSAAPSPISAALTLDEHHVYRYEGRVVMGVTDTLKRAGLINYDGIPQHILDAAAARGKAVHLACEYLDQEILDRSSLDPQLVPYLEAYESFKRDNGFEVGLIEVRRFHPRFEYAGTMDRTGLLGRTEVLLDFKTTTMIQEGHFAQLAAYSDLLPNRRRFRLIALQLRRDGQYRMHEVPVGRVDYYLSLFHSALNCARFQVRHQDSRRQNVHTAT